MRGLRGCLLWMILPLVPRLRPWVCCADIMSVLRWRSFATGMSILMALLRRGGCILRGRGQALAQRLSIMALRRHTAMIAPPLHGALFPSMAMYFFGRQHGVSDAPIDKISTACALMILNVGSQEDSLAIEIRLLKDCGTLFDLVGNDCSIY
jgi:hypothetical protein